MCHALQHPFAAISLLVLLLAACSGESTDAVVMHPGDTADAGPDALPDAGMVPAQETSTGQDSAAADAPIDTGQAADTAAMCSSTPPNILGPYFKAGAPERSVLVEEADPGVRFVVTGRVLDATCQPIAHAELDVWHANAAGEYDMVGYKFRGRLQTDASGRWQLETIIPGWYLNGTTYRPAHIHAMVGAAGAAPLTTQLYFEGDPYNAGDAFILPELIMHVKGPPEGPRSATFDFVLGAM